jgi:hypothetical protein
MKFTGLILDQEKLKYPISLHIPQVFPRTPKFAVSFHLNFVFLSKFTAVALKDASPNHRSACFEEDPAGERDIGNAGGGGREDQIAKKHTTLCATGNSSQRSQRGGKY